MKNQSYSKEPKIARKFVENNYEPNIPATPPPPLPYKGSTLKKTQCFSK